MVPLALLLFLLLRGRWVSAGFLLGAHLAGDLLVVQGLKPLAGRPRPADPLVRVDDCSFPSGHAAGAALAARPLAHRHGGRCGRRCGRGAGGVVAQRPAPAREAVRGRRGAVADTPAVAAAAP
ncbi:hypothetical protein ACGFXC_05505 [Streptomyces sp. NPDC048507]|uniref:hypothetical protein n=1 Tax=Streptomyces sp. NPDC048507 TaxID=3365560 RepID=UPI0037224519